MPIIVISFFSSFLLFFFFSIFYLLGFNWNVFAALFWVEEVLWLSSDKDFHHSMLINQSHPCKFHYWLWRVPRFVTLAIKVLSQAHWKLVTKFNDLWCRFNPSQQADRVIQCSYLTTRSKMWFSVNPFFSFLPVVLLLLFFPFFSYKKPNEACCWIINENN